jgi:hypothetical protein
VCRLPQCHSGGEVVRVNGVIVINNKVFSHDEYADSNRCLLSWESVLVLKLEDCKGLFEQFVAMEIA